jgi:hypothetical protein
MYHDAHIPLFSTERHATAAFSLHPLFQLPRDSQVSRKIFSLLVTHPEFDFSFDENAILMAACEKGYLDIVKLISTKLNVSCTANEPLDIALKNGHIPVVRYTSRSPCPRDPSVQSDTNSEFFLPGDYLSVLHLSCLLVSNPNLTFTKENRSCLDDIV